MSLDYAGLEALARRRCGEFAAAAPFPHVVIDDFLPADVLEAVCAEFDETAAGWSHYHHYNERKQALTRAGGMGPRTQALLAELLSLDFVHVLETLTGLTGLIADPDLDGGGLHRVRAGGFLNVHTDFLAHTTQRTWSRQVNLLIYFNKGWRPEWEGALQLWDVAMQRCVRSIEPVLNRCVIFRTTDSSYHGHPHKLACPEDVERRSLALYYFRDEGRPLPLTPTHYRGTPEDSRLRRGLIATDGVLLRAFSFLKRYTGLSDGLASRILKRF